MTPRLPGYSAPHSGNADTVLICQCSYGGCPCVVSPPRIHDDGIGQFGRADLCSPQNNFWLGSSGMTVLPDHVTEIGCRGAMPEVIWVHARRPVTRMAGIYPVRKWPPDQLKGDMSSARLSARGSVITDDAIAVLIPAAHPFPATPQFRAHDRPVLVDLGPEASIQRNSDARNVAGVTTELPSTLTDFGWVGSEPRFTRQAGALRADDLSGVLADDRAEPCGPFANLVRLGEEGRTASFADTLNRHRDLPLIRNRGATPGAVTSSDRASSCLNFTTATRKEAA